MSVPLGHSVALCTSAASLGHGATYMLSSEVAEGLVLIVGAALCRQPFYAAGSATMER
jgi:hypothetical protein